MKQQRAIVYIDGYVLQPIRKLPSGRQLYAMPLTGCFEIEHRWHNVAELQPAFIKILGSLDFQVIQNGDDEMRLLKLFVAFLLALGLAWPVFAAEDATTQPAYTPEQAAYAKYLTAPNAPAPQAPASRAEDAGAVLFREVFKVGRECAQKTTGSKKISCFAMASPKKCESIAYDYLGNSGDKSATPWFLCIASCADAVAWSRTFGDCSRSLK